jgi:pSer/pThr/pTyr-binding forkhead associated (FHA) protein
MNVIDSKKVSADSYIDTPYRNNLQNMVCSSKNNQNNNNDLNYNNNGLNTSNTYEHNNVSPSTIAMLKKIVDKADLLKIEIINSLTLQRNIKIEINALGMISNSKRKAFDGNTFFGYFENDNENNFNNDNINEKGIDFFVKPRENGDENQNFEGRYFRIRFDINNMKYYIKDLGCGYGTFKKIVKETKLKDSYLINIGNSYIVFTFGIDEYALDGNCIADADKILNIKVFSEVPKAEPYFFNPQQFKKIFIGRDISCNIIVDDTLLSRVHCTIEYKEGDGWVISDGKIDEDISQNRPSTNGTWLYLIEETQIDDKMIFKSNQNVYECHIIKQNTNS